SHSRGRSANPFFRKLVWTAASYFGCWDFSRRGGDRLSGRPLRAQPRSGNTSGPTARSNCRQTAHFCGNWIEQLAQTCYLISAAREVAVQIVGHRRGEKNPNTQNMTRQSKPAF